MIAIGAVILIMLLLVINGDANTRGAVGLMLEGPLCA